MTTPDLAAGPAESAKPVVAVFVHGIFSNAAMWDPLIGYLKADPDIGPTVALRTYEYLTPKLNLNPFVHVPSLREIAEGFATFLREDADIVACPRLALIGHSQGGLVIQHYIADELNAGRGRQLERVREVVMLATPTTGSQFLESLRRSLRKLGWWRNPQERTLLPYDEEVEKLRRTVLQQALYARGVTDSTCPIRISAYAGMSDSCVPPVAARWVFPDAGTLPGNHFQIAQPIKADDVVVLTVAAALRRVRRSFPSDMNVFRTVALDPRNESDLNAVMAIENQSFTPDAAIQREDLRHALVSYQRSWLLKPIVLAARVNEQIHGFVMFHESNELIVVDYIAANQDRSFTEPQRAMVVSQLVGQLRRRSIDLGGVPIIFEVEATEDPTGRESARVRMFSGWGARLIRGISYLAPDMQDMTPAATEQPYALMYARPGALPHELSRREVALIVDRLYNTWYRNWFSHRYPPETLANYLQTLTKRVTDPLPDTCPLVRWEDVVQKKRR